MTDSRWQEPYSDKIIWERASRSESGLYRLPTLSELRDAYSNKITGFEEDLYWTGESKKNDEYNVFVFDFLVGREMYLVKSYYCYTRLILR
ncbi:MAG: hypothetical protein EBS19_16700 [Spirochaetia bacterium]|nr:hypothetical protein [Spirochaetia bacterium]